MTHNIDCLTSILQAAGHDACPQAEPATNILITIITIIVLPLNDIEIKENGRY